MTHSHEIYWGFNNLRAKSFRRRVGYDLLNFWAAREGRLGCAANRVLEKG
jgi:hypothetical protein